MVLSQQRALIVVGHCKPLCMHCHTHKAYHNADGMRQYLSLFTFYEVDQRLHRIDPVRFQVHHGVITLELCDYRKILLQCDHRVITYDSHCEINM